MKHLVIGMDIDGVIVDMGMAMLPVLSKACKRKVVYQDLSSWDLCKALNIDEKTMADAWKQILNSDFLQNVPPVKGAREGLARLSEHEIWLVTSRPLSTKEITISWLHNNKIRYDHIVFNRRGDKLSVGPAFDVFVEDFVEEARVIAEAGIFTILFDQPWNHMATLPGNCKRVYDWDGLLLLINSLTEW